MTSFGHFPPTLQAAAPSLRYEATPSPKQPGDHDPVCELDARNVCYLAIVLALTGFRCGGGLLHSAISIASAYTFVITRQERVASTPA